MKLKFDFITQDIDGVKFLVPVGADAASVIIRSNNTAAFIVDCLKEKTTEKEIVDKLYAKYDAPYEIVVEDVAKILNALRSINAIED